MTIVSFSLPGHTLEVVWETCVFLFADAQSGYSMCLQLKPAVAVASAGADRLDT